jgi:hypothetical protein
MPGRAELEMLLAHAWALQRDDAAGTLAMFEYAASAGRPCSRHDRTVKRRTNQSARLGH